MARTTCENLFTEQSRNELIDSIRFEELFNAVADAMLLVDSSGHVVLANPAALRLFGYAQEEICGQLVENLMPDRFRKHHRQHRKRFNAEPRKRPMGNSCELIILNRHGEEIAVNISLSPVTVDENDHEQVCVLVTFIVLDRRRQAEYALRESEERLWLIKQAAGAGIFDIDCVNGRIYCDERMRELWWNQAEEIMTLAHFFAAIHPGDRIKCRKVFDEAVNPDKEGRCRSEFRILRSSDNSERWIATLGQTQFENGLAKRIVGIARDITERKTLELSLQQQRNETEALFNQQVAILTAAAIAHELNSPLTAISAYSEVAHRALSVSPVDYDQAKEAFDGCFNQAQLAGKKLYELVSFLQGREVETEAVNLNRVVEDTLLQVRSDGYEAYHLTLDLEPDLPAVKANRTQIQRVMVNLIRNAVEAMRAADIADSEISIAVKTLGSENTAMVTISDNGPGVDPEVISRIFEPFFTTKPTGFGMGLSISRSLIETNGGQLWVDPDFRQGAQFHFTLPFV
ncbi:MAG: PAS domain S-box protein [Burkholderiales bacterium]|nr:PAS domain S-box protein [Burkholderiales bacterium]MDR4518887.1 PAS domain S-box protein [Nitrosomonas sp.]